MNSTRKQSLLAGSSLILMAAVAGFAYGYAYPVFNGLSDQSAFSSVTGLFYSMIAAFGVVGLLDVVVAWKFWQLFQSIDRKRAFVQLVLRLVYTAFLVAGLIVLVSTEENGSDLKANLALFQWIWMAGMVIFGVHLIVVSQLLCRTNGFPKAFTFMALFAGYAYVVTSLLQLFWPGYADYRSSVEAVLALPMALGELLLAFWLLFRGGKSPFTRKALANPAQ